MACQSASGAASSTASTDGKSATSIPPAGSERVMSSPSGNDSVASISDSVSKSKVVPMLLEVSSTVEEGHESDTNNGKVDPNFHSAMEQTPTTSTDSSLATLDIKQEPAAT